MLEKELLKIYVDGSVVGKHGAFGGRFVHIDTDGNEITRDFSLDGYFNATSTKMEVLACADSLKKLEEIGIPNDIRFVNIYTDAKYVSENYQEALYHWVGNGWKMKSGKPAPDKEEWNALKKQIAYYRQQFGIFVKIFWKKGDGSNIHINAVHTLAKKAARSPIFRAPKRKIYTQRYDKENQSKT